MSRASAPTIIPSDDADWAESVAAADSINAGNIENSPGSKKKTESHAAPDESMEGAVKPRSARSSAKA
eukprot:9570804-Lingulodinium_polyedra.AAC.1